MGRWLFYCYCLRVGKDCVDNRFFYLFIQGANALRIVIGDVMPFRKIAFAAVPLLLSTYTWADAGSLCCPFSDERLKENIKPLDRSLENILKLKGVSYTWKENKTADVGLIAQDVEKVYPELVKTKDDVKQVDYQKLVAPLIEAVREQQEQINALKADVAKCALKK
ncbi:tail fiber domain-containing protein [Enterobacter sp. ECC-175]|uniref:tail fiber domain-containing protein n=1 Tax=Enterobacter sp. ECC-175 TaxID=3116479 RepID=UPI003754DF6C